MKRIFTAITVLLVVNNAQAQLLKNIGNKIKQKTDQKIDQKIDKTIDDVTNGKKAEPAPGPAPASSQDNTGSAATGSADSESPGLTAYSRFDFVPGDKILYAEDFSQDVVGEFPAKWNTNGSGDLMTIKNIPGKWLHMVEDTRYEAPYKAALPDNFTVEYDLLVDYKDDQRTPEIVTSIYRSFNKTRETGGYFTIVPNGGSSQIQDRVGFYPRNADGYTEEAAKNQYTDMITNFNHKATPVHVAIWIQKQRFRAWINQEKVYDLPRALSAEAKPEQLAFELSQYGGAKENFQYYISNIKIAAATPDNRNKLITEGKWNTSGILFDVNSDQIKPASYGVLKDIAAVLAENPGVKVKIIGHTDSDGDDKKNFDLSKRRAAAVKTALATEFNIDASRMETDGKGESQPIDKGTTLEAKASNRRVEFVKM